MNKRVVILGAGESGVGAALLSKKLGFDTFVSDLSEIKDNFRRELDDAGISYEEKKHSEELIFNADIVVKSPGIPDKVAMLVALREKGIEIVSEIEFAARYSKAKYVCITGSNGKTTTTLLTYHILKNAGINVGLAGNIGQSLARQVAEADDKEWYVLELSSFQLDGMYQFRADIAILMNITPDHLDRYEYKMENYIQSKFRVIQNQTEEDAFIYCLDDENITKELERREIKARQYPFSNVTEVRAGAFCHNDEIQIKVKEDVMSVFTEQLAIQGQHNRYNTMAAGIVARLFQIRKPAIRESLISFKGVEHRLERVLSVRGMEFINDSKATNVNSTWYALESMKTDVIWIAGGVDKGNDYSELMQLAGQKVKALICLGVDNKKLLDNFQGVIPTIVECGSMHEAVKSAYYLGEKGDTILLSPACASFDLFDSYEHRGREFKECVRNL
ncbi:UDP-N-acetylmuramoyl-L-alanine--D-glutamate ligase [Plebeiibacterium sediminum]|uniref:UDP-N-acetylmuramoylalanine--D-glutamate ligase n=1 Tax=Plebeiibacterium sediminum TaxID=2992112 RepID=A0AAE3M6Z9_9BACT|nr:UDP-N-acetylmuramoyl-L-alanine--D-glutamate ligase [Plebeiobacterium sediminum]MCW3788399.1 UDP-N-acetylmuramoyl-L-alanine--D-glutamate ligase [Plebeiobacterium sediminum]